MNFGWCGAAINTRNTLSHRPERRTSAVTPTQGSLLPEYFSTVVGYVTIGYI